MEVADASLAYDQGVKLELYAKAGIQHYWIFNLQENCLEVYSQPPDSGLYGQRDLLTSKSQIMIPGTLGAELSLDQVFSLG
ncbi:MAG: Uma2 family endonuclease [Cyanophyceae cyanobacterium]